MKVHTDVSTIACDLTAIPANERERHQALARRLFGTAVREVREQADGYAFRFAAEEFAALAAFVANERLCCGFLTFTLETPPRAGDLWLRLSGDAAVKAFIAAEFVGASPAP
jgi:hypothetical protein